MVRQDELRLSQNSWELAFFEGFGKEERRRHRLPELKVWFLQGNGSIESMLISVQCRSGEWCGVNTFCPPLWSC